MKLKPEKKFRPERDSNPWPLRYWCSALPTELSSSKCHLFIQYFGLCVFPLQILTGPSKQEVGGPFLIFWQLLWTQFYNLNLLSVSRSESSFGTSVITPRRWEIDISLSVLYAELKLSTQGQVRANRSDSYAQEKLRTGGGGGGGVVKICRLKKHDHVAKSDLRTKKSLQKSLKFSECRGSIRKQIRPSCRKIFRILFAFVWFRESNELCSKCSGKELPPLSAPTGTSLALRTTGDKDKLFILFIPLFTLFLLSKIECSLWYAFKLAQLTSFESKNYLNYQILKLFLLPKCFVIYRQVFLTLKQVKV